MTDILEQLISQGAVTPEQARQAADVPPHIATSRMGRLVAAGADVTRLLEALSGLTGLPLAPLQLLNWPTAVHLLPAAARQMRDAVACPVQRDPQGTLHVVVADPEALPTLDKLLVGFKVYLAPEARVRALLQSLYAMSPPEAPGDLADAVDVDMESSRRNQPSPAAAAPPASPDPLAPRPSGSFKRRVQQEEETMRVPRALRAPTSPGPEPAPAPITVLNDRTPEEASTPASLVAAMAAAEQRAFRKGVMLGAGATALLAIIVFVAVLAARG